MTHEILEAFKMEKLIKYRNCHFSMAIEKFLSFEEMALLARKAGDWIFDGNYLIGDYKGIETKISKERISKSSNKEKYSIIAKHEGQMIGSESCKWRRENNYQEMENLYDSIRPYARQKPAGRIKASLQYARFLIRSLRKQ
jgi:hypothetical protein